MDRFEGTLKLGKPMSHMEKRTIFMVWPTNKHTHIACKLYIPPANTGNCVVVFQTMLLGLG